MNIAERPERNPSATPLSAAAVAARAIEAMRSGRLELAWLCADKLCRMTAGIGSSDAYLLRSAVFALRGEHAHAEADLSAAAHLDPDSPALNRALTGARERAVRLKAARRLLCASDSKDRDQGYSALAREKIDCVGTLHVMKSRLICDLTWNGPETVTLLLRTDIGERNLRVHAGAQPPQGFEHRSRIEAELPDGAQVATLDACGLKSLFEPATLLLLPPSGPVPNQDERLPPSDLLIVVPVYDDRAATMACLGSLVRNSPKQRQGIIVVVDDASPDPELSADLRKLAARGDIRVLRNAINMGFAGSVNRALRLRYPGQDLLLLNADTIVPDGAIEGLARHIRSHRDIGTATPLSNNGESTSLPLRFVCNPMPGDREIAALHAIAARVNAGRAIEMPNGIGFCIYVRGELCDRLGLLSHDYGRGYYEDVEFCLEAVQAGYRNVCATDVFVGHHGGRSFAQDKRPLVVRNLRRISARYPPYPATARAFESDDPLQSPIARIEEEVLHEMPGIDLLVVPADTPAILTNAIASGIARNGRRLVLARAHQSVDGTAISFAGADGALPQNIEWQIPADAAGEDDLVRRLSRWKVELVMMLDVHSLPPVVENAIARLAVDTQLLVARPFIPRPSGGVDRKTQGTAAGFAAPMLAVTETVRQAMASSVGCGRIGVLNYPQRAALAEIPRTDNAGETLAVVGMAGATHDVELLRELARALAAAEPSRTIVVAGRLPPNIAATLPAAVHFSGPIDNAELPGWLTRLRPRALLFADRDWGMADPRAAIWSEGGAPIARFDCCIDRPHRQGRSLLLPRHGLPAALADAIVTWLASVQT